MGGKWNLRVIGFQVEIWSQVHSIWGFCTDFSLRNPNTYSLLCFGNSSPLVTSRFTAVLKILRQSGLYPEPGGSSPHQYTVYFLISVMQVISCEYPCILTTINSAKFHGSFIRSNLDNTTDTNSMIFHFNANISMAYYLLISNWFSSVFMNYIITIPTFL